MTAPAADYRSKQADLMRERRDSARIVTVRQLTPEQKAKRLALEADDFAWLRFMFPALFWYDWQPQQRDMIEAIRHAIMEGDDQAIAASRGEGKTKCAERLLLKYSLQGTIKLSVLFAATGSHAEDSLRSIMGEVEENDLLATYYPEVCDPVRGLENTPNRAHYQKCNGFRHDNDQPYEAASSRFSWCGHEILLPRLPGSPSSGAIIATRGLDAAVRGLNKSNRRVDVAIIDDPDTEDSSRSEEQADKLMKRIDRAIGGLGSQQRGVGRVVLTTLQSRVAVSYLLTDPAVKPSMKGKRFKFMLTRPERMDLWEEYIQLRKLDWHNQRNGDATSIATDFYIENRVVMDAGAAIANPHRHYPDQLSAIQFYFDEWARKDEGYVLTELDNDPPETSGQVESGITPELVKRQVSGMDQGFVPEGCTFLTIGIDVGKSLLHWVVRAWKPDGTGYTIDYGRKQVHDTKHGSDEGLDRAIRSAITLLVKELRDKAYCQQIRDSLTLVDSGYRTDAVYNACQSLGLGIMPIKGFGKSAGCVKMSWSEVNRKTPDKQPICDGAFKSKQGDPGHKLWLICANADKWKAWEHDRWMTAADKPGCMFLWGDKGEGERLSSDQIGHGHYAHQICNEVEVEDIVKGVLVRKWKSKGENHYLDASYYADVAAAIKGVRVLTGDVAVAKCKPAERPSARMLAESAKL